MKTTFVMVLVVALGGVAHAGSAQVSSIVQEEFTIAYERPSGESETARVPKPAKGLGYTSVTVEDGGSVAITVTDGTGATVATGTIADNGHYLLVPDGKGYTLERVGVMARDGAEYQGAVIVNALPESYAVDLFGHYGKIGVKKAKIAKRFDVKEAVKIPAGDDRFKVMIHLPDGSTQESFGMVDVGRYHVIHKTYEDEVTVSSLGYIDVPKKKGRKGK
jgi:hypothetical protein